MSLTCDTFSVCKEQKSLVKTTASAVVIISMKHRGATSTDAVLSQAHYNISVACFVTIGTQVVFICSRCIC